MMNRSLCYTLSLHSASSFDVEISECTYICDIVICGFSFNVKMKAAGEKCQGKEAPCTGSGLLASLSVYNGDISICHLLSSRVADSHGRACSPFWVAVCTSSRGSDVSYRADALCYLATSRTFCFTEE